MSVGMPESLKLHEFGSMVWDAFGDNPYHVGSSLIKKSGWRDVDVRLILSDEKWEEMELGHPEDCQMNPRWRALVRAFTLLGREITGLPIDFQIQQQTDANKEHDGDRSALGLVPHRMIVKDRPTSIHDVLLIKRLKAIANCSYSHTFRLVGNGHCEKCGWVQGEFSPPTIFKQKDY